MRESLLEVVRLQCQTLQRRSPALCKMWPCKRCLGQEGWLCQVPVALLWGSTWPLLCSSSACVVLLCWLMWAEPLDKLISASSYFCTARQGRNPALGLYFCKAMPHSALCACAHKAGIWEERSCGEGVCFPYKSKPDPKFFSGQCVKELFAGFAVMLGMAHILKFSVQKSKVSCNLKQWKYFIIKFFAL